MVEGWLCMLSEGKIFGMDVRKLIRVKPEENVVVNWGSLSSPPFDFSVDLPHIYMHAFVLDSRVHLAGGMMRRPPHPPAKLEKLWIPSYKIYELDIIDDEEEEKEEKKKKEPLFTASQSVPEAPVPFDSPESLVANISGDVYFLVRNRMLSGGKMGVWILRSGLKRWEALPPPPPLDTFPSFGFCEYSVVPSIKIFLAIDSGECSLLCCFNHRTGTWEQEDDDNKFMNSFCLRIDGKPPLCFPSIMLSVPGLTNNNSNSMLHGHGVVLSWSRLEVVDECGHLEPAQSKMRIHAFLVNEDGVCLHQPLEECFEGIQPICYCEVTPFLVDLGDNTVCALLCGRTKQRQIPLLWVSVFTLAMKDEHAFNIDTHAEASLPIEQSFLSVRVLGKHVFSMRHHIREYWKDAFICPPTKKEDTRKRKE